MKQLIFMVSVTLGLMAANAVADHHAQDEGAKEEPAHSDPAAMTEAEIMAVMAEVAAPGDPHAKLAESVGSYVADMSMFMDPSEPPTTATMTVERTMDLGGRVLTENWSGEMMGQSFEGRSRTGYDNVTKRYWSTWTDNWSTGLFIMYGDWDAEQQAMVFSGSAVNPMTGADYTTRSVGKNPSPGKETMVMYEDHGQGEYKSMSFTLTRQ